MDKINFQDLPSIETPINASNLNIIQRNTEKAIEEKHTYSTEEQVIGTYNGKNVYRKIIDTTISVTTLATWTNIGVLGGVVEKVLKITKTFDYCDEKVGAGYIVPTAIQIWGNNVNLAVFNEAIQSTPIVVMIEYTRITD